MTTERKRHHPGMWANMAIVGAFFGVSSVQRNYEFLLYMTAIVIVFAVIWYTDRIYHYSHLVWWMIPFWTLGHLAGGFILIGSDRLYERVIIPLVGSPYFILRYDQIVH